VVFDVVFGGAGPDPKADKELAAAIFENGRVVLAAEFNEQLSHATSDSKSWARLLKLGLPFEPFAQAAAAWGFAEQHIDDDFVIRHYLAGFPSEGQATLTWATASWLRLPVTTLTSTNAANQSWVRYYGPPLKIPYVGYSEALDPGGIPDDFFRDKIVFIGARPSMGKFLERRDEFRSPYHSWANKDLFMPGVEVHATEMMNLVREDWLVRANARVELLVLLLCAAVFGGGLVWLRPIPAAIATAAGAGTGLGAALLAFAHGTWFPWLIVSVVQIPAAFGGSVLFYSVEWYRARRQFEAARRVAEAKIREQAALIDKATDAILVQDLGGRFLYANPSAELLYGWKLGELQKDAVVSELFSPDPEAAAAARETARLKGEWTGELRQQTRGGQVLDVVSRWTLIREESGLPKSLLIINTDITEQKRLEAQFLRTQRMNTIGTLAGGMAHDLNNALAPILMGAQLLRRKTDDPQFHRLLEMMEANTHRSAEMVKQVLLFARGRGSELERLDPAPLVKELEKLVRETFPKSIQVESYLPDDLWPVQANPTQLHQVLLNLCVNARDAMPEGGRLSFAADNVTLTTDEAGAIPEGLPGDYVSLLVSDSGTGMTPEVKARIFEPFFTTKGEGLGTGIGLATVLRIVKSHGGFLSVETATGQGTTMEVFLPRAVETAPTGAVEPAASLPRGQGELILVVDDELAVRDLVAEGLTLQGYRVLTAGNGAEAVQIFQQHRNEVALLFTGAAMPVMSGRQTIQVLRQTRPSLPAILASGEEQADSDGVKVLRKPFALDELIKAVNESLKASS